MLLLISGKAEEQCEPVNRHRKLLGAYGGSLQSLNQADTTYGVCVYMCARVRERWDSQEKLHVPQSLGGLVLGPAALQPSLASTCPAS